MSDGIEIPFPPTFKTFIKTFNLVCHCSAFVEAGCLHELTRCVSALCSSISISSRGPAWHVSLATPHPTPIFPLENPCSLCLSGVTKVDYYVKFAALVSVPIIFLLLFCIFFLLPMWIVEKRDMR